MLLVQLLINGLQLGAIYALTAVGFALIFGSTKVFHVAHGASFTLAAYILWRAMTAWQWHWLGAVALATLVVVLFGSALERFVYRPIQRHEGAFFTVFVAAFGVQIVVQNAVGAVFGRNFETVSVGLSRGVEVAPNLFVAPIAAVAVGVALAMFVALHLFLARTDVGAGLRALADNPDLVPISATSALETAKPAPT